MNRFGLLGTSALRSAIFLAASASLTAPAFAQEDPQDPPETTAEAPAEDVAPDDTTTTPGDPDIVVTGSRIARPNFETLQPSVVIDSQQIESRGFETLGQAINEQPSFGVPGASPVGGQAG